MKQKTLDFLRASSPFLITIGLWRLGVPFWNPAGILAIIPIFFCTFVRPIDWFLIFSIFMCVAIDYNFETVCYWLAIYCFFYSVNAFQNFIDIKRMDYNGIFAFMFFFGVALIIQVFTNFTFVNLVRGLWVFSWATTLYLPITKVIQKVHK